MTAKCFYFSVYLIFTCLFLDIGIFSTGRLSENAKLDLT